ncbi:MAG TPA: GtrA family protein [Kofleriaceae bacterium]
MRQVIGSGLSGVTATAVDVGALVVLTHAGISVPVAAFISATLGAVVGFTMNKLVAFRDSSKVTASQLGRFGAVAVLTALLMAFAMELVAVKMHVPTVVAKLICSALVFCAWTYPAQRRLVFAAS